MPKGRRSKTATEPEPISNFSDDVPLEPTKSIEENLSMSTNPFVSTPATVVQPTATVTQVAPVVQQATVVTADPVVATDNGVTHEENVVSFEDNVSFDSLDKFPLLAKDEVCRLSLVSFGVNAEGKPVPLCRMTQYFFDQAANFGFIVPKNPETLKKVVGKLGQPKVKFGTIIVKYATDRQGNPQGNPPGFTFYAWMFSTDKWTPLRQLHKEWNLSGRDLLIQCMEPKFQKFQLAPAQDCWWKHSPDADKVLDMGKNLFNTQLEKFFNREVPDQEILIKLGFIQAPPAMNVAAASPFGNQRQITNQVGASASPFSTLIKPQ